MEFKLPTRDVAGWNLTLKDVVNCCSLLLQCSVISNVAHDPQRLCTLGYYLLHMLYLLTAIVCQV